MAAEAARPDLGKRTVMPEEHRHTITSWKRGRLMDNGRGAVEIGVWIVIGLVFITFTVWILSAFFRPA